MKNLYILILALLFMGACQAPVTKPDNSFSFAFLTDIHVQPERNAEAGFQKAIDTVNALNPDLVITGGDLVMDVLGQSYGRSDSLYNIYTQMIKGFKMPVYNTLGNHEVFGLYEESGIDPSHDDYGYKMYEKRIGPAYYSFDHKGWHFMVLNSVGMTPERRYIGHVDSLQMEWIQNDLAKTDSLTPIVVSVHIPMLTVSTQLEYGALEPNSRGTVITNAKEVLQLFSRHNLRLVLQGHLHFYEDIVVQGKTRFITGGAVSARWWTGPNHGMEEGFLLVHVMGEDIKAEYVDMKWEVSKPQ